MAEQTMQLTPEQRKELEEKLKKMSPQELLEFQKQQCLFCQLITGKIPAKKVYEDEHCISVLDIRPATRGHILILPKEHYAIMPQMKEEEIGHLFVVAKKLSQLLLKALRADGTSLFIANGLVAGQKAQHFMVHLIPRKEGDGLLPLQVKLLPEQERQQLRVAVENRLSQLFNLKKEVVEAGSEVVETGSHPKKARAVRKKKAQDNLHLVRESKEESDVTLDDIANLFK